MSFIPVIRQLASLSASHQKFHAVSSQRLARDKGQTSITVDKLTMLWIGTAISRSYYSAFLKARKKTSLEHEETAKAHSMVINKLREKDTIKQHARDTTFNELNITVPTYSQQTYLFT